MAPAKLKQHLTKNYSHMSSKSTDYSEGLLEFQNRAKLLLVKSQPEKRHWKKVI
jgi:hypothetical protein